SGVLWFCAHLLAPVGYQVSLGRCLGAAVLLTIVDKVGYSLKPWIGDWYMLVVLVTSVLIVMGVLWLPFWQSVLTTIIYGVVVASLAHFFGGPGQSPKRAEYR